MSKKRYMNDLSLHLQQVWMLTTLEDKKLVALDLVNNMQFKGNADSFIHAINTSTTTTRIDTLCTDLVMAGEGFGAKKIY